MRIFLYKYIKIYWKLKVLIMFYNIYIYKTRYLIELYSQIIQLYVWQPDFIRRDTDALYSIML